MKTMALYRTLTLAIFTLLSLTVTDAKADTSEDKAELAEHLVALLNKAGYGVRDRYTSGDLYEGETTKVTTTLHEGNAYQIVVASPYKSSDVDVRIYDENDNLIAQDNDDTAMAVVKITPKWSGKFKIVITMHSCRHLSAGWVLQYGFKN
jgi:hypothetical protein